MTTKTTSTKRLALIASGAAIVAALGLGVGANMAEANSAGGTLAGHAGAPLAPGSSGGEVTRGNQSGFFAPTRTNDLQTPRTAPPGSPWR